jgi:hypothetical protein
MRTCRRLKRATSTDACKRPSERNKSERATRLSKRHPLKGFPRSPCWQTECYLALITNQMLFVIILAYRLALKS